ncbi:MAG TPA: hypothetical protein VM686_14260 [Polyangiaceae bacterium]|nr:hypothetical protein [Polyangiaceae bacterium]
MSKLTLLTSSLLALTLACSSKPAPQPETPAAPPASAAAAPPAEPTPAPEPVASAEAPPPAASAPAAEPPPPAEPKLSSSPKAILTASEVAFVINYTSSDPSQAAQDTCSAQAQDDPAKMAACKTKARDEFVSDVIHFKKKENAEKWTLFIYKRKGSNLTEVYNSPIEFGAETDHTVDVLIKGGEGTRPLFKGAPKFVVNVPNDYSIELKDPKYGRLVYDAKIGIVGH